MLLRRFKTSLGAFIFKKNPKFGDSKAHDIG